jgi:hypothetical protein
LVFRDSPGIALSVVGKCLRNRFEFLSFVNCGTAVKESCTLFLGGSGQACNVVESCCFERPADAPPSDGPSRNISIGLLISEGDYQEGEANCDCIITKNRFVNYGYGILVGSQDSTTGEYGHQVTYNTLDNCSTEGIMVKCGDTLVKGNKVMNCARHAISVVAGKSSIVEENRIIKCGSGIRVAGKGHTVANNCIARCQKEAMSVLSDMPPGASPASNILIERNTCVNWGGGSDLREKQSGILIGPGASCVVRKNLFHGPGKPYGISDEGPHKSGNRPSIGGAPSRLIADNISSGECEIADGCAGIEVSFASASHDNYENASGFGAQGWWLKHGPIDIKEHPAEDEAVAGPLDDISTEAPEENEPSLDDEAPEDMEEGEAIFRSFFMSEGDFVSSSGEEDEHGLYGESEEN